MSSGYTLRDSRTGREVAIDADEHTPFEERVLAIAIGNAKLLGTIDAGLLMLAITYVSYLGDMTGRVDADDAVALATLPDWVVPPAWAVARGAYLKAVTGAGLRWSGEPMFVCN